MNNLKRHAPFIRVTSDDGLARFKWVNKYAARLSTRFSVFVTT
uniref:Uncharacterized protein n=1 Tax=Anguilla anguilla TaxID=7936 RepID=A0A0E9Q9X6_ANGAN